MAIFPIRLSVKKHLKLNISSLGSQTEVVWREIFARSAAVSSGRGARVHPEAQRRPESGKLRVVSDQVSSSPVATDSGSAEDHQRASSAEARRPEFETCLCRGSKPASATTSPATTTTGAAATATTVAATTNSTAGPAFETRETSG